MKFVCLVTLITFLGLGNIKGLYEQRGEDLFSINFIKQYTWELLHANHVMMRVKAKNGAQVALKIAIAAKTRSPLKRR
ncbi:hypothetical protein FD724_06740 [Nostoc sp. C057]|uniref:hypothetical protein n=1 Tax=Nostoc sp. C057 TaxID=2576903 RepID=UPI0015C3C3F3|nr:hypothetical protein [Nostoc sp. C057]QLE47836.1 hypothetical protein FD724_06740 [Nostoc sp. C057]